jgi:hypothetical protein
MEDNFKIETVGEIVVLVANQFNLSIFNQYWLIKNGIIDQKDLKSGYSFTPIFNQIKTEDYLLTITPDRLQLDVFPISEINRPTLIESKIGKIIEKLPHTPYTGLGLNFIYLITPNVENFSEYLRLLFLNPESPLGKKFNDGKPKYGGYFSKDYLDFRIRLNVKPVVDKDKEIDKIHFDFNFHLNIKGEADLQYLTEHIKKWDALKDFAEDVIRSL